MGAGTTHWVGTAAQIRPSLEVCCFVDGFLMILARRQPHCTASPGRWEKLMSSCDVPEEGRGEFIFFSVSFDMKIKLYTSASNLNYAVARHQPRPEMKRGAAEIQTATPAIGLLHRAASYDVVTLGSPPSAGQIPGTPAYVHSPMQRAAISYELVCKPPMNVQEEENGLRHLFTFSPVQ